MDLRKFPGGFLWVGAMATPMYPDALDGLCLGVTASLVPLGLSPSNPPCVPVN